MSDVTQRIKRWDVKYDPERIKATTEELKPSMLVTVQGVFPLLAEAESQVRQTLDAIGVPTIQYPAYLCFGKEVWALERRGFSGESLALEVAVLLDKWVARGLAKSTLEAIRTDVFNVGAPVAP
jgi:hypothetical protein